MTQPLPKPWTVDDFLAWERRQPERYEFVGGVIRIMVGGSNAHTIIKGNVFAALLQVVAPPDVVLLPAIGARLTFDEIYQDSGS